MKKRKMLQILIFFVFSIISVFSFLTLSVNISNFSIAKIKLQNAVDTADFVITRYQDKCFMQLMIKI